MADLAVAELAVGQADEMAVGANLGAGVFLPEPIEVRLAGHGDGIVGGVGIVRDAVHDGEDDGFGTSHKPFIIATGRSADGLGAARAACRRQPEQAAAGQLDAADLFERAVGVAQQAQSFVGDQRFIAPYAKP